MGLLHTGSTQSGLFFAAELERQPSPGHRIFYGAMPVFGAPGSRWMRFHNYWIVQVPGD
jgi:hypothetical protein